MLCTALIMATGLVGVTIWCVIGRRHWKRWMAGDCQQARPTFVWTTVSGIPFLLAGFWCLLGPLSDLLRFGLALLLALLVVLLNVLYMWRVGPRKGPPDED